MLVIPCRGRRSATYTKAISADIHTHARSRAHAHARTHMHTQAHARRPQSFPPTTSRSHRVRQQRALRGRALMLPARGWGGGGGSPVSFDGLNPLRMAEEANETSENFAPAATLQACLARRRQRGGTMGERWPWVSVTAAAPRSRGPGRMRPGPSAWTQRGLFSGLELRGGGAFWASRGPVPPPTRMSTRPPPHPPPPPPPAPGRLLPPAFAEGIQAESYRGRAPMGSQFR